MGFLEILGITTIWVVVTLILTYPIAYLADRATRHLELAGVAVMLFWVIGFWILSGVSWFTWLMIYLIRTF